MKNTTYSDLHVRLDKETKNKAETILGNFGISPSTAVNIFYRQVIEHEGLPFEVRKRRVEGLVDFDSLSPEDISVHIENAREEIARGKSRPADEVFAEILGEEYAKI